jgi:hypothetical protein
MKELILAIAGTSVAIEMDEAIAFFLTPLKDIFRGFITRRGHTTVRLTVSYTHFVTLRKFKSFPVRLSQGKDREVMRIIHHVERAYPFSGSPILIGVLNGVLAYNVRSQQGHIYLFRSKGKNFIFGSLHKLLFLFMAVLMAEQNKLMIHGAAIRMESGGCLFLGASGAGKSTVAGYAKREDVLSDDAPVVTKDGDLFKIHASPFSQITLLEGKAANHHEEEAPLTKLIFLHRANRTDIKPRSTRAALTELLRDHIHGFDIMDRELKTAAFHFCCELCGAVPAFDLYFQKNNQFLSLPFDRLSPSL